jgi:hypothetical protein
LVQIHFNDRRLLGREIPGDEAGENDASEQQVSLFHRDGIFNSVV